MDTTDLIVRIGAAVLAGAALGLNRDLHGKPTGIRTLGLVGLGSAVAVLAVSDTQDLSSAGRVIQGIMTGIGFLGAGVIIRTTEGKQIHGLTTAACVWLTACIGITCGIGEWRIVLVTLLFAFLLLTFGGRLEQVLHSRFGRSVDE